MKQAMCGWRAKIGVLTPPNYCIISEWGYVTPEGVTFVPALMGLGDATPEGLKEMRQWAVTESKKLADWEVDIILFGCTSGSFVGGAGYDEDIIEEVQKAVGIPTTTTTTGSNKSVLVPNWNGRRSNRHTTNHTSPPRVARHKIATASNTFQPSPCFRPNSEKRSASSRHSSMIRSPTTSLPGVGQYQRRLGFGSGWGVSVIPSV